jgi:hypothetical protein
MDPKYQIIIPVQKPDTPEAHQRNLQEQVYKFNSLPYGSGVFKAEAPSDPRYYPGVPLGLNNLFIQPDKVISSTGRCKLVDVRNSPFTAVIDNYLLIEEGGWWEFSWVTQHIAPPVGTICGAYIDYQQNFMGYPYPKSYSSIASDYGNQQGVAVLGDWPIHSQSTMRRLEPGTQVRPQGYHDAAVNLGIKVLGFTARLVLSE